MSFASAKRFRFNSTYYTLPTVKENRFRLYHILLNLCEHWEGGKGWKNDLESKNFFPSFFCCSDKKLAKFERLQRAPPHRSTRNRQTLLTPSRQCYGSAAHPSAAESGGETGLSAHGGFPGDGGITWPVPGYEQGPWGCWGAHVESWQDREQGACRSRWKSHLRLSWAYTKYSSARLGSQVTYYFVKPVLSNLGPTDFIQCKCLQSKASPTEQLCFCSWFPHRTRPSRQQPLAAANQGEVQVWGSSLSKVGIKINLIRGDIWEQCLCSHLQLAALAELTAPHP